MQAVGTADKQAYVLPESGLRAETATKQKLVHQLQWLLASACIHHCYYTTGVQHANTSPWLPLIQPWLCLIALVIRCNTIHLQCRCGAGCIYEGRCTAQPTTRTASPHTQACSAKESVPAKRSKALGSGGCPALKTPCTTQDLTAQAHRGIAQASNLHQPDFLHDSLAHVRVQ